MRAERHFSVTLPVDMAEAVERKVASGEYASVSEVIRAGIQMYLDRDAAIEKWLRQEVVPSFDEYEANPSSAIPSDKVMAHIRKKARGKTGSN